MARTGTELSESHTQLSVFPQTFLFHHSDIYFRFSALFHYQSHFLFLLLTYGLD